MTNFDSETVLRAFRDTITRWKPGMRVWNRANGKRGIVSGYFTGADGSTLIQVSYGEGNFNHYPIELSATRITEDDDAEAWREEDA